jgi:small-conductance mechanosensitive channel
MLVRKGIVYFGSIIIFIAVLHQSGYKLTALMGAAGIAGIAIGFASQTSVSNIISGLFLISEKPFAVGDIIQVGTTKGIILSIDLLSVKLRTFDNHLIRIPNEVIIKNEVRNISRFPIRRLDIDLGVAYKEDVEKVRKILLDIAEKEPLCLDEPEPVVRFQNFGDSALEFLYAVWCVRDDFISLKKKIMQDIKERFDEEGIEIPFPHRTLYTGSVTEHLPIKIIDGQSEDEIKSS